MIFLAPNHFFGFYNFLKKKFGDSTLSNIPATNTISSSSTISTPSIPSTNRRTTGLQLHPRIYSSLWLLQIRTAASGTEAENIRLFRTPMSFRVQRSIVAFWVKTFFLVAENSAFSSLNLRGEQIDNCLMVA